MNSADKRVAVVTGSNRGLGLETVRQLAKKGYQVVLTARDSAKGEAAVAQLAAEGLIADFYPLDVTDVKSIQALASHVSGKFVRLDVLVNNAGVFLHDREGGDYESSLETNLDTIRAAMETNVYGPFQLCQQLLPLMKKGGYGRVVNLSSGMGQLTEMNGGCAAYRISKTAINAVTRIFADEFEGTGVLVNSVCPGWVKTDMGGPQAELPIEEGVDTIVWLATLPEGGPTGGFFRERKRLDW